jgi:hypothetical protein
MMPRSKVDSDPVATATMERIGRDFKERLQPKSRFPAGFLLGVGALIFLFGWLAWPRTNADPIGDGRLNNARATPTPAISVPAPRAELVRLNPNVPRATLVNLGTPSIPKLVQMGDTFWVQMPDSRWIVATAMGDANRLEELPLTGNRIGDARWIDKHCFVWLNPIGQTTATWIDP